MASNLHPAGPWRALAALLAAMAIPCTSLAAQARCPPRVDTLVARGWAAYRADSLAVAQERFTAAERACPRSLDVRVALGYLALRQGRAEAADSLFGSVVARDPMNGDGWDGLWRAAYRRGDLARAQSAARKAVQVNPGNADARALLDRLDPDWNRPPVGVTRRPPALGLVARTRGDGFEVRRDGRWAPFYIQGVNLGVALPGKFPSEFPEDSARYAGWLDTLAAMHANTVRVYTILPPAFYRALRAWNLKHPAIPLRLLHGVWTELPPEHDFDDQGWKAGFREEMRHVVDLVHGNAALPARPGHAHGRYDADVSEWVLGYIIGREWEPFAVKAYAERHPGTTRYAGRFLTMPEGPAMDAWMADQCDYLLGYEFDRYHALRPIAYTNWPTLDPLTHPTEATQAEEQAWRKRYGRELKHPGLEYENDAVGLDAALIKPTGANPAGWFASYHAYPYYPDFILYDQAYGAASSSEGRSNYFGYLEDLKRHHAGIPLVIAEYGVPSSRGIAHLQPQGWNHGGHDEKEMARIDARLTREIRESGAAGAILFAWIDEWFKKNWIVIDYEIPLENTRQWHNTMDAEQNYGILGMIAGGQATRPVLGGDPGHWLGLPTLERNVSAQAVAPSALHLGYDASFVYLAVEFAGLRGKEFPWRSARVAIALDTYRRDLGQFAIPGVHLASEVGFEFLAELAGPDSARLRIVPDYNRHVGRDAIEEGDDFSRFGRRPITLRPRRDGVFEPLFVITNRTRFTRDGRMIAASGYDRGQLRFGPESSSTLADWYYDATAGLLKLRLPWNLLNVSDPSTRTLLFETAEGPEIGTAVSDGFRIGVLVTDASAPDRASKVRGALPQLENNETWRSAQFPTWTWEGWQKPEWHQRLKPVYDSMKAVWSPR